MSLKKETEQYPRTSTEKIYQLYFAYNLKKLILLRDKFQFGSETFKWHLWDLATLSLFNGISTFVGYLLLKSSL